MEWINTSVQLPPYGQRVLIKDVLVRVGVRDRTDKNGDLWILEASYREPLTPEGREAVGGIRHVQFWMPLPT